MKFCIFVESEINGGLNTFLFNLISKKENNQIELVCNKNFFIDKKIRKKIKIIRYNFLEDQNKILKFLLFGKKIIKFIKIISKIKSDRILVINGGHPGGINSIFAIIAWKLKKKNSNVIYNFHNLVSKANYKTFIIHIFTNLIVYLLAKKIITVSSSALKSAENIYILKNKYKKIIFNGTLDLSNLLKIKYIKSKKYFLILASYEKRKGIHIAIDAFNNFCEKNNNYSLYICGDKNGGYFQSINNQVSSLKYKSKIKLLPFTNKKINLIAECEALIMPSISFESFGYTLIEAMSLSKIIMASNVGGMPEIIKKGYNGYIFSPNNSKNLQRLLFSVIKEKKIVKDRIKKNARQTFLKFFQAKEMTKKYLEEIKNLS